MYLGQNLLTLLPRKNQREKKVQRKMTRRRKKKKKEKKKREVRKDPRKRKRKKRKKKSRRFLRSQSYSPNQKFLRSGLYLHRHRELLQLSSLCLRSV